MSGLFISFEGVDGCGKSTQIRFLNEYLTARGIQTVVTRDPGGTQISEKIREILLDKDNAEMGFRTEALLYAASRAQLVKEVIRPALGEGKVVLGDRFIDSSLAYQGGGRELGLKDILEINRFATDGLLPDKTLFLDFPPELAFRRMSKKRVHDRLESEEKEFYRTLYNQFQELARLYPERIQRIDVSSDKFTTSAKIRDLTDGLLRQYGIVKNNDE